MPLDCRDGEPVADILRYLCDSVGLSDEVSQLVLVAETQLPPEESAGAGLRNAIRLQTMGLGLPDMVADRCWVTKVGSTSPDHGVRRRHTMFRETLDEGAELLRYFRLLNHEAKEGEGKGIQDSICSFEKSEDIPTVFGDQGMDIELRFDLPPKVIPFSLCRANLCEPFLEFRHSAPEVETDSFAEEEPTLADQVEVFVDSCFELAALSEEESHQPVVSANGSRRKGSDSELIIKRVQIPHPE